MTERGAKATAAQRAALEAGRARRAELLKDSTKGGQRSRHKQLLEGTLTVADLDDDEIKRMRVKNRKGGTFSGAARPIPPRLVVEFQREALKRAQDKIRTATPEAVKTIMDIANDPEVKESDRLKAAMYLIDRGLGKAPETLRLEGADTWGSMLREAFGAVDREGIAGADEA